MRYPLILTALAAAFVPAAAAAQEAFVGVYDHAVDTPFTFFTGEDGADVAVGYRFAPLEALAFVGKPAPYLIASLNLDGDTSFGGGGLSWTVGSGPLYVRPAVGLVVHDAPGYRVDWVRGQRTDLGSRVLFEPEIAVGYRASERLSLEASWMHISQARLFNWDQNPGIDMIGARVNYRLGR